MTGRQREDYNQQVTRRCERALVSLIGNIGPWSERVVLVGGLAPRYIIGTLPLGAAIHVGTADVDLVIRLAVEDAAETYTTLRRNLIRSGFASGQHSYQWDCEVDGMTVTVEFLCDTNQVWRRATPPTQTRHGLWIRCAQLTRCATRDPGLYRSRTRSRAP